MEIQRINIINLLLNEEMWEKFKKLCKANESDASKEMRKFIKRYVAEHSQLFLQLDNDKKEQK